MLNRKNFGIEFIIIEETSVWVRRKDGNSVELVNDDWDMEKMCRLLVSHKLQSCFMNLINCLFAHSELFEF